MMHFQRFRTEHSEGMSPTPAPRRWATTRLSLVKRAGEPEAKQALSVLCQSYWEPVHSFICSLGVGPEDARDVTQGFFEATLLEHNYIATFDPARGKFRSWLRSCAKNYVRNWFKHARRERAGGKAIHISLDASPADARARLEPRDLLTPELLFDRNWALMVIERALSRLREQNAKAGKPELFLLPHGSPAGDTRSATNRELAVLLGKSEGAVKAQKHRAFQEFRKCLRAEVSKTVAAWESIDDEIRELIGALV
jgi:RNA polymerase sigma-70 factor (ECF subfamily)